MDALLALRNRILGTRRFQTFAARFPLTRPIARKHTRDLFDLCAGFVYSQILFACVALDLPERVAARPMRVTDLAAACAMPEDAMRCLLEASAKLGLLAARPGGRFGLGSKGAALRGNPAIGAMIAHHAMLYDDLRDPVALLRNPRGGTSLAAYWSYAANHAPGALESGSVRGYSGLMGASQPMIADEVLAAYDFSKHRCLMDAGGGDGSFLRAIGNATPSLQLLLLDLPAVVELAQERFATSRLQARTRCIGADFFTESWPAGADIISFVRVLHDHDDDAVRQLLQQARAALPAGGTLLIAEPMADHPASAAYFGLYLRAMGSGEPRPARTLMSMLRNAGFVRPRRISTPTPLIAQVIIANVSLD